MAAKFNDKIESHGTQYPSHDCKYIMIYKN